jgi:hypothetical protein
MAASCAASPIGVQFALEIFCGAIFALSSGFLFEKYRDNYWAVGGAATLALISSALLLGSVYSHIFGGPNATERQADEPGYVWTTKGDDMFPAAVLADLGLKARGNVCRMGCQIDKYDLVSLPLAGTDFDTRAYLVTFTDPGFCGSGGCSSAVMILRNGTMYMIVSGLGISDRQAMIIAREALQHPRY